MNPQGRIQSEIVLHKVGKRAISTSWSQMMYKNPTHKLDYDLNLGGTHLSHLYNICCNWQLHQNDNFFFNSHERISKNFNFVELWVLQLCKLIIPTYKLQLRNFQGRSYIPNVVSHAQFEGLVKLYVNM